MDDAEYIFRTDAKEKKITARSARRKVTHSGCKLPSDYLTAKQKRKLNGEVMIMNMNKPMSYDEFKKMPIDLQAEYLTGLVHKYNAMATNIGKMMGTNSTALVRYCKRRPKLSHVFTRHPKPTAFDKDGFEKFCKGEAETDEKPTEETNATTPEETYEEKHDRVMGLLESGMITVNQASEMLGIEFKPGAGWDVNKLNREKLEDAKQWVAELKEELGQASNVPVKHRACGRYPWGEGTGFATSAEWLAFVKEQRHFSSEQDIRDFFNLSSFEYHTLYDIALHEKKEREKAASPTSVVCFQFELRDVHDMEEVAKYFRIVNWPKKNHVMVVIEKRDDFDTALDGICEPEEE